MTAAAESQLRDAIATAIDLALKANAGGLSLDILGPIIIQAGSLALNVHAQRLGLTVQAGVVEIEDRRPDR